MPIAIGTRIGPYEVIGWLGAGGMGEVYRARDPRFARDVAIKLIPQTFATDATRVHRFEQEARAAGQLSHPNILAVYDAGIHDGTPYIVSELLEGESLRNRLQAGALTPRKAVDYARQIADGLAAAHDKGIVHRDLKPDNLFVSGEGRLKILDFGLAKLIQPAEDSGRHSALPTETQAGTVLGTLGYMSPEQVRGEAVDARSDIFSFGTILHEMLTGRPPFSRTSAAETMAAILKEEPPGPVPSNVPPALERIVSRCLEKAREARFQSARDLAFALEVLSGTAATAIPKAVATTLRRWRPVLGVVVVALSLLTALASWLNRGGTTAFVENPLANAQFSHFTDWDGSEEFAEISPDGRFVAFLSDREGQFDIWLSQVGTGRFVNLTRDIPPLATPAFILRNFGFSGDGSEIWFSTTGDSGGPKALIPLTGGPTRPFLSEGATAPAWSPDGSRLVYFNNGGGDPLFLADRTGADARPILVPPGGDHDGFFARGMHNHNPVWSSDGEWIYFVHGLDPTAAMDVWRIRPAGGTPERLTDQKAPLNFLAALDRRTLLYVSRTGDQAGPWLWAVDLERKETRRISSGLEQYTSVSASRDGRRVVASVANPTASLWRVPLLDRIAEERDAQPYPLPTTRALAPRFGGTSLFFLSSRGAGDGLWRYQDGQASDVGKDVEGALPEPPAVSHDGRRVAVVVRREGKRRLVVMSADGTNARTLTESIDVQGAVGLGTADWSPDGAWIATGGTDAQGPGLFKIPVEGGEPSRLVAGQATNPIWSPDGKLIVYAGSLVGGDVRLLGVTPDGTAVALPDVRARISGGYRFLPNASGVVYLRRTYPADFWLLDLATKNTRQVTRFTSRDTLRTFDVSPDGKYIVFDRSRENSNIYLIDLPK